MSFSPVNAQTIVMGFIAHWVSVIVINYPALNCTILQRYHNISRHNKRPGVTAFQTDELYYSNTYKRNEFYNKKVLQ